MMQTTTDSRLTACPGNRNRGAAIVVPDIFFALQQISPMKIQFAFAGTGSGTTTTMQAPRIRRLHEGEIIENGDEYRDPETGRWHRAGCIGKIVGIPGRTCYEYRRREVVS